MDPQQRVGTSDTYEHRWEGFRAQKGGQMPQPAEGMSSRFMPVSAGDQLSRPAKVP